MNAFTLFGTFLLKGEKETIASLDNIDKRASGIGKVFTTAGAIAGAGIAAVGAAATAIGGAVVGMTKNAMGFEKQMGEVYTLLPGLSKEAMASMNSDVLEFAKNMGVLPDEVVPALYQSISAGVPRDNVFEFLEVAQKAAVGGVTELETAVDGITSVVNAYGSDVLGAGKASDLMFTAVKLGKTTFDELSGSLYNVIPTASALGVGFEDVTAAIAAMTAQGTPTSVATTQMRQMFVELSKEGTNTSDLFKQLAGQSFKDFVAEGGNVSEALALMKDHADKNNLGLNDLFGSVEAGNAALALGGQGAETYAKNLEEMKNSLGATDEAFGTMEETGARAWEKIMANFEAMKIEFGGKFLPIFKDVLVPLITNTIIPLFGSLLEKIKPIADKLVEFVPIIVDKLAPAFLSIVELVGDSFIGIFDTLVKDILPPVIDLFDVIVSTILPPFVEIFSEIIAKVLPPFMKIFQVIIDRILPPFMDLFAVIIDKVLPPFMDLFMILVDSILPPLVDFFAMLVETIMPPFIEIIELIMEILTPFIDLFAELLQAILPPLVDIFKQLAEAILPPLLDVLKLIIEYAIKPILDLFGKLIEWAMPYLITAIEYLTNTIIPAVIGVFTNWEDTVARVKLFFETFAEAFKIIWNGIKNFFIGIWESVQEKVNNFKTNFLDVWDKIKEGIKKPINAIIGFINGLIGGIERGINAIIKGIKSISFDVPDWIPGLPERISLGDKLKEVSFGRIPALAEGGFITGAGYALVGDEGPELLRLPQGASVTPLEKSGSFINQHNYFNSPKPLSEKEAARQASLQLRKLAMELGI